LRVDSVVVMGRDLDQRDGRADFNALHSRLYDDHVLLLVFDLLEFEGEGLRIFSLLERK